MRDRPRRNHGLAMRNRRRFYRIKEHREAVKLCRLAAAIAAPIEIGSAADEPENHSHD